MNMLLLRFRDLSVAPGDTIRYHRKAIAQSGTCWWGWWARAHEIPMSVLLMDAAPTSVLLYDTDRALIYRASCRRVATFSPPQLSPDAKRTPSYYNSRSLPAWFEFDDIENDDASSIVGARVAASGDPKVELDWVVGDLDELRRTTTTAWLLGRVNF